MLITKTIEIDMGHRVPNHKSKCCNMHGHRYKFEVGVDDRLIQTPGHSSEGMVIDFGDLKEILMKEIDQVLDHGFMVYDEDPLFKIMLNERGFFGNLKIIIVPFVPTVENITKWLYGRIKEALSVVKIKLSFVRAWETPTSTALCTEEDYLNA